MAEEKVGKGLFVRVLKNALLGAEPKAVLGQVSLPWRSRTISDQKYRITPRQMLAPWLRSHNKVLVL